MVAYWWAPGFKEWAVSDFSQFLPTNHPRVVQGPIQASIRSNNDIWLFGRGSGGDMIRIVWFKEGDRWTSKSLVADAQQF